MRTIRITRKGYVRKGTKVRKVTYLTKDKGAPGRTPKSKRWFNPQGNLHGWDKSLPQRERLRRASIGRSDLSSGRALNQLSNLTTDRRTKQVAKSDSRYFFKLNKKK